MIYHWFGDLHGTSGGYSYQRFVIFDCKNMRAQPNYYNIVDMICVRIISHNNLQLFDVFLLTIGLNFHRAILTFTGLLYIFSLTQLQPHPIGILSGLPHREANISPNHSGKRQPEHLGWRLARQGNHEWGSNLSPSLKLLVRTWKWMVGRLLSFLGWRNFQGSTVSFREWKDV